MIALLTSCGRHDLLKRTTDSLKNIWTVSEPLKIFVNEDVSFDDFKIPQTGEIDFFRMREALSFLKGNYNIIFQDKFGQHASIESFLRGYGGKINNVDFSGEKYYLHLEDDWEFNNTYNWIQASLGIMEADPTVIKVLCNSDSPHPCEYGCAVLPASEVYKITRNERPQSGSVHSISFGYLQPWTSDDGILWHGFSWNPGVTRLDLLRKFMPFPKWEQELAERIHEAGYKVVRLKQGVCKHIGEGRSTHV